jgi:hypothetical protein
VFGACGHSDDDLFPATSAGGARADASAPAANDATVPDVGAEGSDLGDDAAAADEDDGWSQDHSCCVRSDYYVCADHAAVEGCAGFDLGQCLQKCISTDLNCIRGCSQGASDASDPPGCRRDPSHDGLCGEKYDSGPSSTHSSSSTSSSSSNTTIPKNPCGGDFLGVDCTAGACPAGGHCTNGKCYPSEDGNPCTFLSDCGGGHCVSGCCSSGATGSACGTPIDCNSFSCTNNVCD